MIWLRAVTGIVVALLYKLAMFPLALAGVVLVPVAIWFGVRRRSRIADVEIFTAPDWLHLYGNEQEGYDPQWAVEQLYKGWPTFWRRYAWAAWRNKIRNVAFVKPLLWLHRPAGELTTTERTFGKLLIRIRQRSWMVEVEYVYGHRFGDFGPRLDQPDAWGGVSWAFRPWGKF